MRWRWLVITCAVFLAALVVLDRHPLRLPTRGPEAEPSFPRRSSGHPVLLIASDPPLDGSPPELPGDRPADLEWVNILAQAFGGCDVVSLGEFADAPEQFLAERQILVLPRAALSMADSALAERLRPAVQEGLIAMLEMPPSSWWPATGLLSRGEEVDTALGWPLETGKGFARDLTGPADRRPPPQSLRPPGYELPISFGRASLRPARAGSGCRNVASPWGRPLMWWRGDAFGGWLSLAIDLGRLSLDLRQGIPDPGFRLPDRFAGRLPGPGETNDLVACEELLQSDHAWLDAILAVLLSPEVFPYPRPSLWPAPFSNDGWLLLSHDDEGFGDQTRWMTEVEAEAGISSTVFLMPSDGRLTPAGIDSLLEDGVELGLHPRLPGDHFWRDPMHHFAGRRHYGVWKLRPAGRMPSIAEQRDELATLLGSGTSLSVNRNHYLLWPDDVDQGWRRLTGAGFRGDSSYGPDWGAAGWLFGSGMPFRPLSRRGLVHPIWEVPYHSAETIGDVDRERVRGWLLANGAGGHGPIGMLFHPDAFGWMPSVELFELWEALPAMARETRHRGATLGELLDFWEARGRCEVRVEPTETGIAVDVGNAGSRDDLALSLPTAWRSRRLVRWEADWDGATSRLAWSYGRSQRLIRVPAEGGRLIAEYR